MKKLVVSALMLVCGAFWSADALACSDCEDAWCVGSRPFEVCGCTANVFRPGCQPVQPPQRFEFCNVTPGAAPGDKPRCTNCSSNLSGDLGKADCLVRHQGEHVDSGACNPAECSTVNPIIGAWFRAKAPRTPEWAKAKTVVVERLTETKPITAVALITRNDGTKARCTYSVAYRPAKDKSGIQLLPADEKCTPAK
jgi:hypothetical protein